MNRISLRSLATRIALAAGLAGMLAAPLPAFAHDRDGGRDWHRPHPVYVAPAPAYVAPAPVYAAPYPAPYPAAPTYAAPYPAPAYPAPVAYRTCSNALVGGLIGAAAGGLIGAGAAGHGRDGGAAAIMGLIGGAALGTAVGAASCD